MGPTRLLVSFLCAICVGTHHAKASDWIGQVNLHSFLLNSSDNAGTPLFTPFNLAMGEAVSQQTHWLGLLEKRQCPRCGTGQCCDPTKPVCVGSGCCPSGTTARCGSQGCYNPGTSICCGGEGASCPIGSTCATGGGCCEGTGTRPCGSTSCYDPQTQICCSNGEICPKGYDCVDGGGCCPTGQQRCGNSKCYDPKTQSCCTGPGVAWACKPNEKCCGTGNCNEPSTEQCCASGGVCPMGTTCCGKKCCLSGETCNADNTCVRPTPVQSEPPTPSQVVPQQSTTQTIVFRYKPNRVIRPKKGPNKGKKIKFPPKSIMEHMCDAIEKYFGTRANEATLTKASDEVHKENREKSDALCPPDYCLGELKDYITQQFGPDWKPDELTGAFQEALLLQCDEFPFARTVEGATFAKGSRRCVPGTENSWQGGTMSQFFKKTIKKKGVERPNPRYIEDGHKFVIKMENWDCTTNTPKSAKHKRQDGDILDQADLVGDEMFRGFDTDEDGKSLNLMPIALGDVKAGSYIFNLTMVRGAADMQLVDSEGEEYDVREGPTGVFSYTLAQDVRRLSMVGVTQAEDVEISYQVSAVSSPSGTTTSTGSTGATSTARTSEAGRKGRGWHLLSTIILTFAMAMVL